MEKATDSAFKIKRTGRKYLPIGIDERKGIAPAQGFMSISPAFEFCDTLRPAAHGITACIYGEPLDDNIIIQHEALEVQLVDTVPAPPEIADVLPEVRRLLLNGRGYEACALSVETAKARGYEKYIRFIDNDPRRIELPASCFGKVSAAAFNIKIGQCGEPTRYLRSLDFGTGEATVRFSDGRGDFIRRTFVSEPRRCVYQLLELPASGGNIPVQLSQYAPGDWKHNGVNGQFEFDDGMFIARAAYPKGGGHIAATIVHTDGMIQKHSDTAAVITEASYVLLMTKILPFADGETDPAAELTVDLKRGESEYGKAAEEHIAAHMPKMTRSRLILCDETPLLSAEELFEKQDGSSEPLEPALLQMMYDSGRFFLATQTGEYPPMIGQWNINVNLQVCSGNITDLPEAMEVFFAFVEGKLPDYRANAKNILGCRGILADVHPDLHDGFLYHFSRTYPHHYWTACAGWVYNEFFGRYLTSGDEVFLREHVVPGLSEIAAFYIDFLKDKDEKGNYLFYPCWSPENEPLGQSPVTVNAVMDIMVCREVLENLIFSEELLQIEDENLPKYREILEHLPELILDADGALKEWAYAGHPERYDHRHVSHHYDVWPGMKIDRESEPELASAILKSNRKRGQQDDSAHGIMHRLFTAARLDQQDDVKEYLQQLMRRGFVNRNLTTNHFPYRLEFPDMLGGIPAALAEAAAGSKPGRICFLRAMPRALGKGKITGLKLYTFAELVEFEWDLGAGTASAVLRSLKEQLCSISCEGAPSGMIDGREYSAAELKEGVPLAADRLTKIVFNF